MVGLRHRAAGRAAAVQQHLSARAGQRHRRLPGLGAPHGLHHGRGPPAITVRGPHLVDGGASFVVKRMTKDFSDRLAETLAAAPAE